MLDEHHTIRHLDVGEQLHPVIAFERPGLVEAAYARFARCDRVGPDPTPCTEPELEYLDFDLAESGLTSYPCSMSYDDGISGSGSAGVVEHDVRNPAVVQKPLL